MKKVFYLTLMLGMLFSMSSYAQSCRGKACRTEREKAWRAERLRQRAAERAIEQRQDSVAYRAAVEALKNGDPDVEKMRDEYDMRRRLMVDGFNRIGLTCREPSGAFYAFPCIASTGLTSEEFCERLLYSKEVAVVPGTAFGKGGEGFIRASYCYSTEHIEEAIRRMGEFVKELTAENR